MKWIKCSDKLPPKDGTILLGSGKYSEMFLFYWGMGNWHEFHCCGEIAYEIDPVYWMPLPNAPETDGGE